MGYYNTVILRFGLDPADFEDTIIDPLESDGVFIYEVVQKYEQIKCPYCKSDKVYRHDVRYTEYNCTHNDNLREILRVRKTRFKCRECGRTFTPQLTNLGVKKRITNQAELFITQDFLKTRTFADIAVTYGVSRSYVLKLFDKKIKYIMREKMPKILCIDEAKYSSIEGFKYACVLTNFEDGRFVDIVRTRRADYLNEYFSKIKPGELANVEYFISDMYDGYYQIKRKFFPHAIHIVDIFHVLRQLREALNHIRKITMDLVKENHIYEANFMKSKREYFLMNKRNIPYGYYSSKITGEVETNDNAIFRCLKLNPNLMNAYDIYQELLEYRHYKNYKDAKAFIERIIYRLEISTSYDLQKVGKTYATWKHEIINAFDVASKPKYYTNGVAEGRNCLIKTLIKICYGFKNFERMRKRILLIANYKKESE